MAREIRKLSSDGRDRVATAKERVAALEGTFQRGDEGGQSRNDLVGGIDQIILRKL